MSIRDEINARCDEGRLHKLSLAPGMREERELYVSSDINAFLCGPWQGDATQEERAGRLAADLAWFIEGRLVIIPADSGRARAAYMSRLDKPIDEVWDIRSRDPSPGIRVFGRFAEKDLFVGLTWEWRLSMKNRTTPEGARHWRDAIVQCKVDWRNLFNPYDALHKENYPHDYISNAKVI